jgi:Na+-driven multidrug efflux pump
LIAFLAIGWPLTHIYGNTGLWLAFIGFIILRAASLMVFYPNLRKSIRKIDHEI